jgi:hypothetical protein
VNVFLAVVGPRRRIAGGEVGDAEPLAPRRLPLGV